MQFQEQGHDDFREFAAQSSFGRQEEIFDKLLRQGASSLDATAAQD
jgi:hypothetical protein